jgi:hypothetical protein
MTVAEGPVRDLGITTLDSMRISLRHASDLSTGQCRVSRAASPRARIEHTPLAARKLT